MNVVSDPIFADVWTDPVFADVSRISVFTDFAAEISDEVCAEETPPLPGVYRVFGELPDDAIVNEEGLAAVFGKHRKSIKRAVNRGELPPPFRFMGQPAWRVASIREHFAKAEAKVEKEAARRARLVERHGLGRGGV
ncbi:helix-turn-helix transcriptional regulator [Planctomycetota bacterium]